MLECQKKVWKELIELYHDATFLWDTKHVNYQNKPMRMQAYRKLLKIYHKLDSDATIEVLKKRIDNMRTTFNRERKKVLQSIENGEDPPYAPQLWYYDSFLFLEDIQAPTSVRKNKNDDEEFKFNYDKVMRKIYLETPNRKRKRDDDDDEDDNGDERTSSSSEEDRKQHIKKYQQIKMDPSPCEENSKPSFHTQEQPKRRIYELLEKQEKFVDTAMKIINKKEKPWELIGKSIGYQLDEIPYPMQKAIAHKLIGDVIFFATTERLTTDSYICIDGIIEERVEEEDEGKIEILDEAELSPQDEG